MGGGPVIVESKGPVTTVSMRWWTRNDIQVSVLYLMFALVFGFVLAFPFALWVRISVFIVVFSIYPISLIHSYFSRRRERISIYPDHIVHVMTKGEDVVIHFDSGCTVDINIDMDTLKCDGDPSFNNRDDITNIGESEIERYVKGIIIEGGDETIRVSEFWGWRGQEIRMIWSAIRPILSSNNAIGIGRGIRCLGYYMKNAK